VPMLTNPKGMSRVGRRTGHPCLAHSSLDRPFGFANSHLPNTHHTFVACTLTGMQPVATPYERRWSFVALEPLEPNSRVRGIGKTSYQLMLSTIMP
jgi:hypothetical protein